MLQSSTINFIKNLGKNNNKPWFETNRAIYDNAREDFEKLVAGVIQEFGKTDEDIAPLIAKKCVFRQYRDVRFSKDKTPYKNNMGASFDKGGKKSGLAGYYLHVEPGNKSFVGGGIWMPEAEQLKKVRQEIDYNWNDFSKMIKTPAFKKNFGDLHFGEYQLSREPKGYDKENPAIEYLKLKSFVTGKTLKDEELLLKNLLPTITSTFKALMPLINFINRSLE